MFLMITSTKIDQNIQLDLTTWPSELKIEIFLYISLAVDQYIISYAMIQVRNPGPKGPLVI